MKFVLGVIVGLLIAPYIPMDNILAFIRDDVANLLELASNLLSDVAKTIDIDPKS